MQRAAFALLLVCASSAALAKNVATHEAAAPTDSGSSDVQEVDSTTADKPVPPKVPASAHYVKPAAPAPHVDVDGTDGDTMPHAYFGKWHSFLPGMFR
jgi:uncharacterized protein involved in copper resistance